MHVTSSASNCPTFLLPTLPPGFSLIFTDWPNPTQPCFWLCAFIPSKKPAPVFLLRRSYIYRNPSTRFRTNTDNIATSTSTTKFDITHYSLDSQLTPWHPATMAPIKSPKSNYSSSNYGEDIVRQANILASCYMTDSAAATLKGLHYCTTGLAGAEWYS
jgi:hypothetical protein